jgi:hypothetical protein
VPNIETTAPAVRPKLLDRKQAAASIPCSLSHLINEVKAGRVRPILMGRRVLFTEAEIERYISALPTWSPISARREHAQNKAV